MSNEHKDIVIVTGGGRCGTYFLGQHLKDVIDNCFSVHEPDILYRRDPALFTKVRRFGLYQTVFGKLIRRRGLRVLSIQAACRQLTEAEILRRLKAQRAAYYRSIDASTVVEANAAWWGLTQFASTLGYPARVVCMIRDPFTWIASWQQHGGLHDRKDVVAALRLGRLHHPEWGNDPVLRLACTWREIYTHQHALCIARQDHRMYRFEDVFSGDDNRYRELLGFIAGARADQIDWPLAKKLRATPSNASKKTTSRLDDSQIAAIWEICEPLATEYGYTRP